VEGASSVRRAKDPPICQEIQKKSPAKKRARRKAAPKRARAAAPKPEGVAAGGPIEVPRANVGAAVQAAISFEKAVHVTAEAVDASAETFLVTWA
jgi:hypothetical protein